MGFILPSLTIFFFVLLQLALLSSVSAFNITYALENHPEFSTYNKLLTRVNLAKRINNKLTVTVMAVRNSPAMDFLAKQSDSVVRQVLATHSLLDYLDASKLAGYEEKDPQPLTTFWQQSGKADKNNGNILAVRVGAKAFFRSGEKGAKQKIKYVREVATQPYNISLIEVSQPLFAPGLSGGSPIPSGSPGPVSPLPIPPAEAPSPDDDADAPEPDSDDAPDSSPSPAPSPSPSPSKKADDDKEDDEPAPKVEKPAKSAGNKGAIAGSAATVMVAVATLIVI